MSRAAPTPRRLLAVIWGLFCASGAYAQIPERVQRCLPYPTFAEEVASLHQESLGPSLPKVITIEAVDFDGPTTLPKANLARLVSNLEGRHFDAGSNWLDEVTDEWVRGAWQDDGYFKANATATTTNVGGDSENQHVALHVHVDEGLQYFMGDLRFQSADLRSPLRFTLEELSELVTVRNGDIFVAGRIRQSLDALRQLYASHGYIDFTLEPLFDVDDAARRISLTLQLDQHMQFRIGTVEISGFDSTGLTPPLGRIDTTGHLDQTFTYTVGSHQFRFGGDRSWTRTALALRDRYGPFVLAYLEAVVRVADWRASEAESK